MEEDEKLKLNKRTKLFQTIVISVNTLLSRWSNSSNSSAGALAEVESTVAEVIKETEHAAIRIGESFQSIMRKTRRQTQLATNLVKRADNAPTAQTGVLGLQDYVNMCEERLQDLTARLSHLSELAGDMVDHQKRVREETALLDHVLDEMHTMASSISHISLKASITAVNQEFDPNTFIAISDRIRAIAEQSSELERRARQGLDSIRHEVATAATSTSKAAEFASSASLQASIDTSRMRREILLKGSEIEHTLDNINVLGQEINREIQAIIVAMQFQDITQQKLEKVRGTDIGSIRQSLNGLSHETMALMQRDLYRAVLAYSQSSVRPSDGASITEPISTNGNVDLLVEPAPDKPRAKIELF